MSAREELKHFYKYHKFEIFVFIIIYLFSIFVPFVFAKTLIEKINNTYLFFLIIFLSNLPVGAFTAYSYKNLGFEKYFFSGACTVLLLWLTELLILNIEYKLQPDLFNWAVLASLLVLIFITIKLTAKDKCRCRNT